MRNSLLKCDGLPMTAFVTLDTRTRDASQAFETNGLPPIGSSK